MAHFKRLFRAHARATSTASLSDAAPVTVIATVFVEPSASPINWAAKDPHTSIKADSSSASVMLTSDAPLPIRRTVSLVDVQPSESILL